MQGTLSIVGSNRGTPDGTLVGPSNAGGTIRVSVYVRRHPEHAWNRNAAVEKASHGRLAAREYTSAADAARLFGASEADVTTVMTWAKAAGLATATSVPDAMRTRRVELTGTIAHMQTAFGTKLDDYEHQRHGRFRARTGTLNVPVAVQPVIEGVFGLDTRHLGTSHRRSKGLPQVATPATNPWPGTFLPGDIATAYAYPNNAGAGQRIAVLAFNGDGPAPNGGYSAPVLARYFQQLGIAQSPKLSDVVVQGDGNKPGPDTEQSEKQGDSTGEIMLDLCVVGALVPAAEIFVYFTEFTSQGWVDAIHQIVTDAHNCTIVSCSYGNPEDGAGTAWTKNAIKLVDQAFETARARGITILCASGDDGSGDGDPRGAHADFPASSPNVTGVGGTKLVAKGTTILSEVVWNETAKGDGAGGGGISAIFTLPDYQQNAGVPPSVNSKHRVGRGVPDVSAVADPLTGCVVAHISGGVEPIGGTSLATPLWAALAARLSTGAGKPCGFLNTLLYPNASALDDIVAGNNGAYEAKAGWDACTGLGTPNGIRLAALL